MGIFGYLSKAHSDQSLVGDDVQAKIAVYDEKIKTSKDNIDANRKALKQMDEAVDQVMARSSTETGADRAVAIRRSQLKERARLQSEIQTEQKTISSLSQERAPIAAEVRKVEAEVGPIKYIAQFVYGESDKDLLEKAVTWVIIILIAVFDPLAVILLLASQISFQNFRDRKTEYKEGDSPEKESDVVSTATVTTSTGFIAQEVAMLVPEAVVKEDGTVAVSLDKINSLLAQAKQEPEEKSILEQHPYLNQPFSHFQNLQPMVYKPEEKKDPEWERWVEHAEVPKIETPKEDESLFVQNEEQKESNLWSTTTAESITPEEYMKTLMDKFEQEPKIAKLAAMVKSGRMDIDRVPEELRNDVKKRI
jgi:hypothetical protein